MQSKVIAEYKGAGIGVGVWPYVLRLYNASHTSINKMKILAQGSQKLRQSLKKGSNLESESE